MGSKGSGAVEEGGPAQGEAEEGLEKGYSSEEGLIIIEGELGGGATEGLGKHL